MSQSALSLPAHDWSQSVLHCWYLVLVITKSVSVSVLEEEVCDLNIVVWQLLEIGSRISFLFVHVCMVS